MQDLAARDCPLSKTILPCLRTVNFRDRVLRGIYGAAHSIDFWRPNRTWNGVVFNLGESALTACQPRSR
jgi:hypothetical protein